MTEIRAARRLCVVVGFALAAALALTGCAIPQPSGGTDGGASGGSEGVQSDDSQADPIDGFDGVPATFPSDVPILSGSVPFGVDLGTGWTVIVQVSDIEAAFAEASDLLRGAGFDSLSEQSGPDGSFGVFDNDRYQVQLTVTDSTDYGPSASYVVVLKG